MRKLVVGNWKMNGLASSLAEIEALKGLTGKAACDVVVCPPFTLMEKAADGQLRDSIPAGATSSNTAIGYEPVWAIGTGLIPTIDQIKEIQASIRQRLVELLGEDGRQVRILHGGSVKASNAAEILGVANVDGALVGGASLKATDFAEIIAAAA